MWQNTYISRCGLQDAVYYAVNSILLIRDIGTGNANTSQDAAKQHSQFAPRP